MNVVGEGHILALTLQTVVLARGPWTQSGKSWAFATAARVAATGTAMVDFILLRLFLLLFLLL